MMACSVGVQAASLLALRNTVQWKGSLALIIGGILGVPIAVYLLQNTDTRTFRMGFGVLVALYAGYTLFRPTLTYIRQMDNQGRNVLIGFGGGLIGGLTAMPGALPTIWCDMHGMPKNQQRGIVQPFIAAMQIFALALMLSRNDLKYHRKGASSAPQSVPKAMPASAAKIRNRQKTIRDFNRLTFPGPF